MSLKHDTILITGANRGLGLGLVKAALDEEAQVLVTTRRLDAHSELATVKKKYSSKLEIYTVDVGDQVSVENLANELKERTIDVLVNNAGIFLEDRDEKGQFNWENILKTFAINTMGPMRLTEAFLPHLERAKSPRVVTLSSLMGSIGDNGSGGYYGYRISKAAVNMWNRTFAKDHKNIIATVLHPGWVQTDMGGKNAPLSIEESCRGMIRVISQLDISKSGEFYDFKGKNIPW